MAKQSDQENPIGFFEYFIDRGFLEMYKQFFQIKDEYSSNLFDDANDVLEDVRVGIPSITREEEEAGAGSSFIYFEDELSPLLATETSVSISIIKTYVLQCHNDEQAMRYGRILQDRVINLIKKYHEAPLILRYSIIEVQLQSLISATRNATFSDFSAQLINNAVESVNEKNNENSKLKSFEMSKSYFKKIEFLHSNLIEQHFIAKTTSLEAFKKTFNAEPLPSKPFIKWIRIAKKSGKVSVADLIRFILILQEKNIIKQISNIDLKKIIPRIFLKQDEDMKQDEHILNIAVSFSELKKAKTLNSETEIYMIIENFMKS